MNLLFMSKMITIRLLCIGDSLTFGYEMEPAKRWTNLLEKSLTIEVINSGINGDTTSGMLSRFSEEIKNKKPTHTLIFGGTNDLSFGLTNQFIISNIYAMCKQALYFNVLPIIVIPTPCLNLNEHNFIGENYSERILKFQEVLMQFCSGKDINYVNFCNDLDSDCFMNDGMHYNMKGHKTIANHFREKLHLFS